MSEISVTVNGSTTINPTVGNGDTVNVTVNPTGERGPTGSTGSAGPANTLAIGTVTGGSSAAATITGTAPSQTLSLVLPAGATGATGSVGATGSQGPAGPANTLSIGTVTSGTAAATITGTSPNQTLNLVLQKGDTGAQGPAGVTGPAANLADETPQPLGIASAGTALSAARADHVHSQGSITYSGLSGIPSSFAPSAHVHAVSDVTGLQTALDGKQAAGTYATLVSGTVPSSQLPSYVDDVIEYANLAGFPATGETGKIVVARDTGKIYRWSGSAYIEISPSPGSTDSVTEGSTNLYFTNTRAAAAAPVQSVAGRTGTVTLAQLGSSGTASSTTFLRGDGQWTAAGGLGVDDDIDGGWYYGTSGLTRSITITSSPTNQTASSGAATFAVTAASEPSTTLSYQWQKSDSAGFAATQRTMPTSANWYSVTYGNGTFVAVSVGGGVTSIAATSTDGITWTQRTMPVGTWYSVTYGGGTFVAVSSGSTNAATSTDGITWTQRTLPADPMWYGVTYGNGTFVAVAYGSSIAATSPDGITWTQRTLPASANWNSLSYGGGTFVAATQASTIAATSPDGITWTQRTMPASANWTSVAYGGSTFVAVVNGSAVAATSADGITWTQRTLPVATSWTSLTYGGGTFVAVAASGSIAATSTDGIAWTQRTLPATASWQTVAYGGSTFVAIAYNSSIAATITLTGQSDFANVSGATSAALALTGLTNASDNADQFRVVVSATGATSVTSQSATLTVSG